MSRAPGWGRRARAALGWALALLVLVWRGTCRTRRVDDPRPALRRAGRPYLIALRHAHQLAAVLGNDEPRLAALVSRSPDGDLLIPSLRLRGVEAVRGSTRTAERDKGGGEALARLAERVGERVAVLIAVDGPLGPRGRVHGGIAELARRTGAAVVPLLVLPSRRWILKRSWDRFQIPLPFSTLTGYFGEPLEAAPGEPPRALRQRVARALDELERRHDPGESRTQAADE